MPRQANCCAIRSPPMEKVAGQVAGNLAVNFLLGKYGLMAKNPVGGQRAATQRGKSCRPSGRQLGRQLSPREIWTYGEKSGWRPTGTRKCSVTANAFGWHALSSMRMA